MPIVPQTAVTIPNQVLSNGARPYVAQMNYGQMIGQLMDRNPDLTAASAGVIINSSVRKVYDRKTWFSCFIKGQVVCPQMISGGSVTATLGSPLVTGVGTAWTPIVVGRQFRIGYNNPIYTITALDEVNQVITLEMPWGAPTVTSGYFIAQYYFNLGPNIKYLKTMVNMQLGYRMRLHLTQDWLNQYDPWRQQQNFPWGVSPFPIDPNGNYQVELYPVSTIQQALPFMAYIQPPNLVNDTDCLPAYIRADVVLKDSIAEALVWRGPKYNKYYDANESRTKRGEFESELLNMANADENLYRTQVMGYGEDMPLYQGGGATWDAQHAVMAGDAGYGEC